MRVYPWLLIFWLVTGFTSALAQESRKFKKSKKIRLPARKPATKAAADPAIIPAAGTRLGRALSEDRFAPVFEPRREPSLVTEDTSSLADGPTSLVEVEEQVRVDSSWIRIAGYYSVWDSRNVNPYNIDARGFADTVGIQLYDEQHGWAAPLKAGIINSIFGFRGVRWHYGTDLDLAIGDSVRAAFDGIVRIAKWDGNGYGNYVLLRHYNGLETIYGHLTVSLVEVGQLVKAGDLIGWGGTTGRSSGPHLHYEVRYQGNPINPTYLYDFGNNRLTSDYILLTPEVFQYRRPGRVRTPREERESPEIRRVFYHKVRGGDTLGEIASRYGVSAATLRRLNKLGGRSTVKIGQRIRIK